MSFSFYSGSTELNLPTVVLTGVARSGKTLLGNILGSCKNVEHVDEPWLPMMLPIMAGQGIIPEALAIQIFRTYTYELLNDRILMRHVNFRPSDLSSVWRQKTPEEIFARVIGLSSRDDVREYIRNKCCTLVLTLTDTLPFCGFLRKALPGCRILHVAREGLEVALEVMKKRWYADEELRQPHHSNLFRPYVRLGDSEPWHLPWWVGRGDEEHFLNTSAYAKALYYWYRVVGMALGSTNASGAVENNAEAFWVVRFSDLVRQPRETVGRVSALLDLESTHLTERLLASVHYAAENVPEHLLRSVDRKDLVMVRKTYQDLCIPTCELDKFLVA